MTYDSDYRVRLLNVELHNFQNVQNGVISLPCNKGDTLFEDCADIVGIYGQNGSGKTAFVRAMAILKAVLRGDNVAKAVPNVQDYIAIGKESATLKFKFSITNGDSFYMALYEFTLQKSKDDGISVVTEKLSYWVFADNRWSVKQVLMETSPDNSDLFTPQVRIPEITLRRKEYLVDLHVAKKQAEKESSSFVFCKDMVQHITKKVGNVVYADVVGALADYGVFDLWVISNRDSGLINADLVLPFAFKYNDGKTVSIDRKSTRLNSSH